MAPNVLVPVLLASFFFVALRADRQAMEVDSSGEIHAQQIQQEQKEQQLQQQQPSVITYEFEHSLALVGADFHYCPNECLTAVTIKRSLRSY